MSASPSCSPFCSFLALVGYEFSALSMIGRRLPLPQLALASFATQSIAHSTGFAFVVGATLRYNFYADRGLGIGDVAKVQMFFTATFTLGVATLAGAVVMIEPFRLAAATGLPPWLWRLGAATALALVIAYVVWGAFFHRPLRWRGHELVLPSAGATLTQIFFGVADLMAVAAALYVLLPAELGLGYLEVLAVFMASIVVGLMSHVPGSLGVFESAVVLLLQPSEAQTLPLIGSLLAFRARLLPAAAGLRRDRPDARARCIAGARVLGAADRPPAPRPRPDAPRAAAARSRSWRARRCCWPGCCRRRPVLARRRGRILPRVGARLVVSPCCCWRAVSHQGLAAAWHWVLALLLLAVVASALAGAPMLLPGYLVVAAVLLFACRTRLLASGGAGRRWPSPAWVVLLALTLASSFWLLGRG